jgi:oxygen-independent coproporphyrinogen-3 oxidase
MSALYIHIPYCKQRCIYCDFYSSATRESKKEYLQCLIEEWEQRKYELNQPFQTIYIGGGTPSTLNEEELEFLFKNILKNKDLFTDNIEEIEITFEANPENLNRDYLKFLKENTPINRLSIGIQSFDEDDLKLIGRRHSGKDAIKSVNLAQEIGFDNISIDLMFGLPNMTESSWQKNLYQALMLNVQHISAYQLSVEDKTMLSTLLNKGKLSLPNEEQQIKQFKETINVLTENHFEHYEISNYALIELNSTNKTSESNKKSYRSKHNSSYWQNVPYLGIGASSHSYCITERRWNISDIKQYVHKIKTNQPYWEKETLSEKEHYNEYILVGVRTKEGFDLDYMQKTFSEPYIKHFLSKIDELQSEGLIEKQASTNNYALTLNGLFLSNQIALILIY